MARLFADENFSYRVVAELRQLGHDVTTARELGLAGRGTVDADILDAATADGRATLTHDRRDFGRLHMQRPVHAGIVICTRDLDFVRQAQRIHDAISTLENLSGRLIRVNRPGPGC